MATARQLERLMASMEPGLARAFREAVDSIKGRAAIGELEAAIEAFDIEGALRAAGVRDYSYTQLSEAIRESYAEAGAAIAAIDVPRRFGFEFNMSNPRAQRWIEQHSSELITGDLLPETREAVRMTIGAGFEQGRNPRSIALDIVGRVGRTGRRQGGIIGLNAPQTEAVLNARNDLQNLSSNYFNRTRRDRRFDAMVRRSIEEGTPLNQSQINRIVGRYEDRLLQTRAETVARTESLNALNESNHEAMRQVVDEGLAQEDAITRTWDATLDSRTRPEHAQANGQERGINEPFQVGGFSMMRPGDGPASMSVNCRCVVRNSVRWERTAL